MNQTVRDQLLVALRETASGRWSNTRAIALALERKGHRMSEDSVKRYLGMLQTEGIVDRDFQGARNVWQLKLQ